MHDIFAPLQPAFVQSPKHRWLSWRIAASFIPVLARRTLVRLVMCFINSLHSTQLRTSQNRLFWGCVEVVGKLVKSLSVSSRFIPHFHSQTGSAALPVVVVNKLDYSFKQYLDKFTQDKLLKSLRLNGSFYTLPTRPTNTTNLNKGIGL